MIGSQELGETTGLNTSSFFCGIPTKSKFEKPKRTSGRWENWSIFVTVCLCFVYLFTPTSANYTITPFAPQTMAYVEKCNNVNRITGYWNLALHTNLDVFYGNVDQLHESMKEFRDKCKNAEKNSVCSQVMAKFENRLQQITNYERAIRNNMATRSKRSLGLFLLGAALGTVGPILMNYITSPFQTAQLRELLDKQTTVVDLAVQSVMDLEKTLNNSTARQNEEIWSATWLTEAFDNVMRSQNKIIKMITLETFEINEVPFDIMVDQAKIITYNMKNGQHLFGETTFEKALNLYKIARLADILFVKNSIISIIEIPMIASQTFECHEILPIPFSRSPKTEILTLHEQYTLFNNITGQYCIKSKQDMDNCLQLNDNTFCEMETILLKNETNVCQLSVLLNDQNYTCKTTEFSDNNFLRKLKPFTWLYFFKQSAINIECINISHMMNVHGSGLLHLGAQCKAKIDNIVIQGLELQTNNADLSAEQWKAISLELPNVSTTPIKRLEAAMQELKEETTIHRFFHVHHTTILYIFIVWICGCLIIMFVRGRSCTQPSNITINN